MLEINLERHGCASWETKTYEEVERVFQEKYLRMVGGKCPHFVWPEGEVLENSLDHQGQIFFVQVCKKQANAAPNFFKRPQTP